MLKLTMLVMPWVFAAAVCGQEVVSIIDFEEMDESTEISDAYESLGVTFSIQGGPGVLPIICVEGNPVTGYNGGGADSPMSSGSGGLTDPFVDGDPFVYGGDIVMTFDPPVTSVRFFVIDLDGTDSFTARAFNGNVEVDVDTHTAGQAGTGNGVSTQFELFADPITSVVLEGTPASGIGFALDFLSFTRPCIGNACGPQVRVSQESAPGAGDFDDNVLGLILPYAFAGSPANFYAYDVPLGDSWNGLALDPVSNRSHILVGDSDAGTTIYLVHDRPNDGAGGQAGTRVEVLNDPDGAFRSVEDDPASLEGAMAYVGEPGGTVFTAQHLWSVCCTDGHAISDLSCEWKALVSFSDVDDDPGTPVVEGMVEWVVYSATGDEIVLALEEDRRVLLEFVPGGSCPPDVNYDNVVAVDDLLLVLGAWGPCDPICTLCPADINGDDVVAVDDLLAVLGSWGECPEP